MYASHSARFGRRPRIYGFKAKVTKFGLKAKDSHRYTDVNNTALCSEYTAEMVPLSCCTKSQYGVFVNVKKCQNWPLGPPNLQTGPDRNEAVYYEVCNA